MTPDLDHLTEPQQIALSFLAIVEGKRLSQVRRDARPGVEQPASKASTGLSRRSGASDD